MSLANPELLGSQLLQDVGVEAAIDLEVASISLDDVTVDDRARSLCPELVDCHGSDEADDREREGDAQSATQEAHLLEEVFTLAPSESFAASPTTSASPPDRPSITTTLSPWSAPVRSVCRRSFPLVTTHA